MKAARTLLLAALAGLAIGAASAPASAAGYYYGGHYAGPYRGYYGGHYVGPYRGYYGGYWGGPRVTFGYYGGPWYWGPGYWGGGWAYPYGWGYSVPPVVVVPSEPSVYVEPGDAAQAPQQQQWWYWCQSTKAYYPYVSTCSEGWQRVAPQPQGTQ